MGTALIKIRIMPESPDVDLTQLETHAKVAIEKTGGKFPVFALEPIAFGLKAVIVTFQLSEDLELDPVEEKLRTLENVNSVQVIDMRRAIG